MLSSRKVWSLLPMVRHHFIATEAKDRIGRAIRNIPLDYLNFFTRPAPHVIDLRPYHPQHFSLLLHVHELLGKEHDFAVENIPKTIQIDGVNGLSLFARRLRFLLLWGHFFWRVPDMRALRVEVSKVVLWPRALPVDDHAPLPDRVIMRVYWQLKSCEAVLDDGDEGRGKSRDFMLVQLTRLKRLLGWDKSVVSDARTFMLYSGISRYVFDGKDGWCRELHLERLEPPLHHATFGKQKNWLAELSKGCEPVFNTASHK